MNYSGVVLVCRRLPNLRNNVNTAEEARLHERQSDTLPP